MDSVKRISFRKRQGRQQTHHIVTCADGEHVLRAQLQNQIGVCDNRADPHQKALATDFSDHSWVAVLKLGQPLLHQKADILHILQKRRLSNDVQHRIANRHTEWIATIGRAMGAGRHAFGGFRGGHECTHGKPTANAFGHRHDVWRNARPFMGKKLARAPNAALHLIKNQQQAMLVAQLTQAPEALGWQHPHTSFALHGLHQNGRRFGRNRCLKRLVVAKGNLIKARRYRAKALQIFLLAAGSNRRQRAPMESAFKGDNAETLRLAVGIVIFPGRFYGAFKGLGTGVREKGHVCEGQLCKAPSKLFTVRDRINIGGMPEFLGLFGQSLDQMGMGMPNRRHGNATAEIEVSLTINRVKPNAFSSLECKGSARVGRHHGGRYDSRVHRCGPLSKNRGIDNTNDRPGRTV